MATSGTYAFSPDVQDFIEEAFERCGVDPATITGRHIRSARRSMNFLFAQWAVNGINLFSVDLQTEATVESQANYTAADGTIAILEVVVRRLTVDTPIYLIDRQAYEYIPNKTNEGLPTQLFYNRVDNEFFLWNTPENSTDSIRYWRLRRIQDVVAGIDTPDIPYEWMEALSAGLAEFLALKYALDRYKTLQEDAAVKFKMANDFNRERVDTNFQLPMV
jgi:hypothetical protein